MRRMLMMHYILHWQKAPIRHLEFPANAKAGKHPIIANLFTSFLSSRCGPLTNETIILTGSQAIDDIEGEIGACVSEILKLPYISVVTGLKC